VALDNAASATATVDNRAAPTNPAWHPALYSPSPPASVSAAPTTQEFVLFDHVDFKNKKISKIIISHNNNNQQQQ
jgi:hypothetical protein